MYNFEIVERLPIQRSFFLYYNFCDSDTLIHFSHDSTCCDQFPKDKMTDIFKSCPRTSEKFERRAFLNFNTSNNSLKLNLITLSLK